MEGGCPVGAAEDNERRMQPMPQGVFLPIHVL